MVTSMAGYVRGGIKLCNLEFCREKKKIKEKIKKVLTKQNKYDILNIVDALETKNQQYGIKR